MTETSAPTTFAAWLRPLPADWGWYDVQRLATPAEMTACAATCGECGNKVGDKYGPVSGCTGTVIGRRSGPTAEWTWSPVMCRPCETAHSVADGY